MENGEKGYIMSSLHEYFKLLEKENAKRSEMIAKSLTKYLRNSQTYGKFDEIQSAHAN